MQRKCLLVSSATQISQIKKREDDGRFFTPVPPLAVERALDLQFHRPTFLWRLVSF